MQAATSSQIRVLIADGESRIRQEIGAIVESLGAVVVAEAADGESAVALFAEHRPQMVIFDIDLPKLSGDHAFQRVVALGSGVVGLMMSSRVDVDTVRRCIRVGARDYIRKNDSREDIHRAVSESWAMYASEIGDAR